MEDNALVRGAADEKRGAGAVKSVEFVCTVGFIGNYFSRSACIRRPGRVVVVVDGLRRANIPDELEPALGVETKG